MSSKESPSPLLGWISRTFNRCLAANRGAACSAEESRRPLPLWLATPLSHRGRANGVTPEASIASRPAVLAPHKNPRRAADAVRLLLVPGRTPTRSANQALPTSSAATSARAFATGATAGAQPNWREANSKQEAIEWTEYFFRRILSPAGPRSEPSLGSGSQQLQGGVDWSPSTELPAGGAGGNGARGHSLPIPMHVNSSGPRPGGSRFAAADRHGRHGKDDSFPDHRRPRAHR